MTDLERDKSAASKAAQLRIYVKVEYYIYQ